MCIPSVYQTMSRKKTVEEIVLEHLLAHAAFPAGSSKLLRDAVERARVVAVLDAWAELVDREERGCRGHDEGRGETEYCDGSCRTRASLKRCTPKHWWVEVDMTANGLSGLAVHTDDGDIFPIVIEGGPDAARAAAAETIENGEV